METTIQDIEDLVTVTVKDLGGDSNSVQISGDNILIGDKPVSIDNIKANVHSAQGFLKLIKEAM